MRFKVWVCGCPQVLVTLGEAVTKTANRGGSGSMLIDVTYLMFQIDELEERLNDAIHQKQVLSLRLDSQLKLTHEENR